MSIIKLSTVPIWLQIGCGRFLQAFDFSLRKKRSALLKYISSAFVGSLGVIIYLHLHMVPSFVKVILLLIVFGHIMYDELDLKSGRTTR